MGQPEEGPIVNRGLSLEECLPPDFGFLEIYQQNAYNQIVWDESGATIRGKQPRRYMYDGLCEEMGELLHDDDRIEPNYHRLGALMRLDGNVQLQGGVITTTAAARHIKEFGDVSWYLANYLRLFRMEYPKVIDAGLAAWKLDKVASPRAELSDEDDLERRMPWFKFMGYAHELTTAAHDIVDRTPDGRIPQEKALLIAAGKFTLSMMHMAVNRFNTTYETILEGNHAKIAKRTAEGTIFDKSGGDDR